MHPLDTVADTRYYQACWKEILDAAAFDLFVESLYGRREEALRLRPGKAFVDDWNPAIHECYRNVDVWIQHSPQHKRVNGFLYFTFNGLLGYVRFVPHCVIEIEDGTLVDITPHGAGSEYPFIPHIGTSEQFGEILDRTPYRGIDFTPR